MSGPESRRPRSEQPPRRLLVDRCERCRQVLAQVDGCTATPHETVPPWGSESWWDEDPDLEPLDRCPDCWARIDHPHHWDCLRAWCNHCEEPLYMCAHVDEAER